MLNKKTILILVGIIALGTYAYMHNRNASEDADIQTTLENAIPEGETITFDDIVDVKVIKNHSKDDVFTYDFIYQDKLFGHITLTQNWFVQHFLSYNSGDELFGFSLSDTGMSGKYYWGPSIVYTANIASGSLEKLIDLSTSTSLTPNDAAPSNSLGSDVFVTDVSEDKTKVIYCNYWQDRNIITLKNLTSGDVREFEADASLTDFGDAMISTDETSIAFAGITRKHNEDGSDAGFVEAKLFTIDTATGAITTYQTNQKPGYYIINGWLEDNEVDYEYIEED